MMKVFNTINNKVEEVEQLSFESEKDIQKLIEPHVETFFGLKFVKSEFTVDKYRVDTLCFNEETNSFVIIEYKKGSSYSVIDQGYTYLQLLLNHKSDFLLVLSQYFNKVMRVEEVDWSQSRLLFVSPFFNSYQKDSVNFKDLPFELWEIKNYSNGTVVLNQHQSTSKESIDSFDYLNNDKNNIIQTVKREVQVVDEQFHLDKLDKGTLVKWFELKEKLEELENVEIEFQKPYITLNGQNKKISYLYFRKNHISIEIQRGNVNPDGSKSKKYFTLDDPANISVEGSWEWKTGTKGTIYKIKFDKSVNIDYIMFLIKQKYDSLR